MAAAHWRLMRLWANQKAAVSLNLRAQPTTLAAEDVPTRDSVAFATLGPPRTPSAAIMDRFETSYDRQFARSLRLLRRRNVGERQQLPTAEALADAGRIRHRERRDIGYAGQY